MILRVRDCIGYEEMVLAGSQPGSLLFGELVRRVGRRRPAEVVFLDFGGIGVATSSFLRESILAFRTYCRSSDLGLWPVVANANDAIIEELEDLLLQRGDAIVVCELEADGQPVRGRVLGHLEPAQRETLDEVVRAGEADAVSLARRNSGVQATAWNNRLAYLASKAILLETRLGRSKMYRPVVPLPEA